MDKIGNEIKRFNLIHPTIATGLQLLRGSCTMDKTKENFPLVCCCGCECFSPCKTSTQLWPLLWRLLSNSLRKSRQKSVNEISSFLKLGRNSTMSKGHIHFSLCFERFSSVMLNFHTCSKTNKTKKRFQLNQMCIFCVNFCLFETLWVVKIRWINNE